MKNRIEALLEKLQLSPSKFADELGMQRSAMSHILSGRNKPSLEVMQKILNRFPEVSIEWLIQGKGSLYGETKKNQTITKQLESEEKRLYDIPSAKPVKEDLSETILEDIIEQEPLIIKNQATKLEPRPQLALFDIPPTKTSITSLPKDPAIKQETTKPLTVLAENKQSEKSQEKAVKSIVMFYSDNTFSVFKPGESLF